MRRSAEIRRIAIGSMGILLSGCAIQTPHLAIEQWPLANHVAYYDQALPYRVAVLPLTDQRPAYERRGQRPRGLFLGVWNRRAGDYYTADQTFGDQVGAQLGRQLTDYLRTANVFRDAQAIPAVSLEAETIRQVGQAYSVEYVIGGDLEHFFGSQHQEFSMYVLPLYFVGVAGWQNSKTLPWGQTTIRVALYAGRSGDLIWQHEVEGTRGLPRETDSMAEAAMQSFAAAADQLAAELRQLPLASRGEGQAGR